VRIEKQVAESVVRVAPHLDQAEVESALNGAPLGKLLEAWTVLMRSLWMPEGTHWPNATYVRDWVDSLPGINEDAFLAPLMGPSKPMRGSWFDVMPEDVSDDRYRPSGRLPTDSDLDRLLGRSYLGRTPAFEPPPVFAVYLGGAIGGAIGLVLAGSQLVAWPTAELTFAGLALGALIGALIASAEATT